jgi:hypothetical protein
MRSHDSLEEFGIGLSLFGRLYDRGRVGLRR